ncbi:hypothetical protein OG413_06665 [Streptomyces sp. NBC_01433]|uniref:hypothetical protein n=1 Tax=Streptomyces sp. NBC_01433 TaxID=2903864 RepID=UPI00224DE300|nr:hypothetical protein [Streptomyces sp. NBC_01433]MCX4675008.1 hypothetical protein [Streptomyces sp. NBC_01433]
MGTVLKGMSNVQWHELQHARGSASQVPGMLSRIAWGDAPSAEDALSDLEQWIGALAVFDATVAAVPFLWELAGTETVRDRAGVLELLRTILSAGHHHHPEWARGAHEAVVAGRATAERLAAAPASRQQSTPVTVPVPTPEPEPQAPSEAKAAAELLAAIDGHVCAACPPRGA